MFQILLLLRLTQNDFRRDIGHSSDWEQKKECMERTRTSPKVYGTASAEVIMIHLRESQHPVFRATSALDRRSLKSKKGGKLSIHHNGDLSDAELLFRTVISVSQLSVYGAMTDWCEELAQHISDHSFAGTEKPVAKMNEQ